MLWFGKFLVVTGVMTDFSVAKKLKKFVLTLSQIAKKTNKNTYFRINRLQVLKVGAVQHHEDMAKHVPNKHNKRNCKMATLGRVFNLHVVCTSE